MFKSTTWSFSSLHPTLPSSVQGMYYLLCLKVWAHKLWRWMKDLWVKISTCLITSTLEASNSAFLNHSFSFNKLRVIMDSTSWEWVSECVWDELNTPKNSYILDILWIFLEINSSICMGEPFYHFKCGWWQKGTRRWPRLGGALALNRTLSSPKACLYLKSDLVPQSIRITLIQPLTLDFIVLFVKQSH